MIPARNASTAAAAQAPSTSPVPGSSTSQHQAEAAPAPAPAPAERLYPTVADAAAVEEGVGGGKASTSSASASASEPAGGAPKALPALPASTGEEGNTVIEVNGAAVTLDKLGPMVIGRDGTVSRIANWNEMCDLERQNTLRILGKRNQLRLANLRGETVQEPAPSKTEQ
ncbi:hypothetical protein B0T14DRAFT_562830 [Immersiella caudata]|uniref:Uncharacterized protein n=1 Tax=Immersiella caudata TaxID=314043 RepID=A0AA39X454_9PEZI|nr:hypothetical protein B0T14DRAFT_562830 [Immersiella caudata]